MEADDFMARVEAVAARAGGLGALDAAILLAVEDGIARDTRTFARIFGVAHALALRAAGDLADALGLVEITGRDPRTQRTRLALTEAGRRLVAPQPAPLAA